MKENFKYAIYILAVLLAAEVAVILFQQRGKLKLRITPESIDYWEMFSGISVERQFIEEADAYYNVPIFTPLLQDLSGKEIRLTGYYLPYSRVDSVLILSNYPYASCFFCGGAGIESVAMVELEKGASTTYETDQILTVNGKLELNARDIKKLAFVITDATVEEVED